MFHKTEVYAKTMIFLWNTQIAGTSIGLLIGLYLGNEDSEMWKYSRAVSFTTHVDAHAAVL